VKHYPDNSKPKKSTTVTLVFITIITSDPDHHAIPALINSSNLRRAIYAQEPIKYKTAQKIAGECR